MRNFHYHQKYRFGARCWSPRAPTIAFKTYPSYFQSCFMIIGFTSRCAHYLARASDTWKVSFLLSENVYNNPKYHEKSIATKLFEKFEIFNFSPRYDENTKFQNFFQIGQKCSKVLYVLRDASQCVQGVRNTLGTYYGYVKRCWDFRSYIRGSMTSLRMCGCKLEL